MKLRNFITASFVVLGLTACTKLDQKLQSSIVYDPSSGAGNVTALLNGTYNDFQNILTGVNGLLQLECNSSDESLVPTRGGDWDDGGVWRQMHAHTFTAIHPDVKAAFNQLGQMESDAISTLAFNPAPAQAAEALFLRSVAQFYFLDLFGQVPYREIADYNSIKPAPVYTAQAAVDNLVSTLTTVIGQLPATNSKYRANPDAARFLLMKVLLNKGAFINRANPTFDAADMAQVISLGNDIINSGKYSLTPEYFDNFGPNNATTSKEAIWAWPNNGSANIDGIVSGNTNQRWMNTLHYNSWDASGIYGSAGWNGFSTVADFYNTFEGHGDGTPNTVIDTTKDQRLGGRFYPGVTDSSGLRPGLLAGLQKNQHGVAETDRQGNPLTFTPDVSLVEKNKDLLERTGIRVVKYPPDYTAYNGGNQRNQFQIFRYADVLLMVAEAKMRTNDEAGALLIINDLRTKRGASVVASMPLVNESSVSDPNTLLAERGRELYWENWRRQDLIRFGMFLKPWALKSTDDPKYLLFPIPPDQLIANPNLIQNEGY